jgi:hypothetical protein
VKAQPICTHNRRAPAAAQHHDVAHDRTGPSQCADHEPKGAADIPYATRGVPRSGHGREGIQWSIKCAHSRSKAEVPVTSVHMERLYRSTDIGEHMMAQRQQRWHWHSMSRWRMHVRAVTAAHGTTVIVH